ncbi:hypothetical protein H6P81_002117 [Aristolochia fimbriata]|uniref:Uncharacterized protein n=1 Tax=Aristolochia fimbriata TaxID=158543 RepID=A0AAV7FAI2_ARIFI|nr:hypothetical protein H6P81_002117 [Aristolochia fimbriata]
MAFTEEEEEGTGGTWPFEGESESETTEDESAWRTRSRWGEAVTWTMSGEDGTAHVSKGGRRERCYRKGTRTAGIIVGATVGQASSSPRRSESKNTSSGQWPYGEVCVNRTMSMIWLVSLFEQVATVSGCASACVGGDQPD